MCVENSNKTYQYRCGVNESDASDNEPIDIAHTDGSQVPKQVAEACSYTSALIAVDDPSILTLTLDPYAITIRPPLTRFSPNF